MIGLTLAQIPEEDIENSKDRDIRKVYNMDVSEIRVKEKGTGKQFKAVKSTEAIPPIPGKHIPESVSKRLEDDHQTYHLGQEHYDERCALCLADPTFKKKVPTRFKVVLGNDQPESSQEFAEIKKSSCSDVVTFRSGSRPDKDRCSYAASINAKHTRIYLGCYSNPDYRDYAYDCALRALGLDLSRLKFNGKLPDSITKSVAEIIEANVAERLKKGSNLKICT